MGPAILYALGGPGGFLLAVGLAGLGIGFFWQRISDSPTSAGSGSWASGCC